MKIYISGVINLIVVSKPYFWQTKWNRLDRNFLKTVEKIVHIDSFITRNPSSPRTHLHEVGRVFHKLYENANCGIFVFTLWK